MGGGRQQDRLRLQQPRRAARLLDGRRLEFRRPSSTGIATNGTDIWLVDNKQDKVYKYTGAASRLSGSQNAASSFNLNSSNSNAKGIVTDGTSLWVVNDATTNKVFKYTLSGSLLGSWTIDAANASPTGITINPTNVSDIWIVDNGTDKVYQYTAAAGRTSGSQSAAATFALAAGNTNPQDIADPPAPGTMLASSAIPLAGSMALLQGAPAGLPISATQSRVQSPVTFDGATLGQSLTSFSTPVNIGNFGVSFIDKTMPLDRDPAGSSAVGDGKTGDRQALLTPIAIGSGAASAPSASGPLDGVLSAEMMLASADISFAFFGGAIDER